MRVYPTTPESREEYATEMHDELDLDWVEPGTHVGVIRSTEAPDALFDPDAFDAFVQSGSQVPDLGTVVAAERGEVDDAGVGRTGPDGITVFYNRGMGIQFAAVGRVLYNIAERAGLGLEIPTELLTQEYHP